MDGMDKIEESASAEAVYQVSEEDVTCTAVEDKAIAAPEEAEEASKAEEQTEQALASEKEEKNE